MQQNNNPRQQREQLPLMNERIKAEQLQVIDHLGANLGIISRAQALDIAHQHSLDLVILTLEGPMGCPLAKIMDYGKEQYEKKRQQHEAKKNQKVIQIKEIKLQPKIADHDFQTKMNKGLEFLEDGKRLKITIEFRGREIALKEERGGLLLKKIEQFFQDAGIAKRLLQDKELKTLKAWTRTYYLK
jgi:translation initiation factor IF-3